MSRQIKDWQGKVIGLVPSKGENPMLSHGYGPEGKHCRDCSHLVRHQQEATWYKCDLRAWKSTSGNEYPGGDHRVSWPACSRYEQREKENGK